MLPSAAAAADLCRITVHGPAGRIDLAIPTLARIGALLPTFVLHLGGDVPPGRLWSVQRLGEGPLDTDGTAASHGLRDGDELYLRDTEYAIPPLEFDDLSHGVGEAIRARGDRWRPESTYHLFLGLVGLCVAGFAATVILAVGPGTRLGWSAGIVALLLACGAALTDRQLGRRPLGLVLGLGAIGLAALVGPIADRNAHQLLAFGPSALLTGGLCAAALGALLAAATCIRANGPLAAYGTAAVTALAVVLAMVLAIGYDLDITTAVTVVAVVMFEIGTLAPRIAPRLARLRLPDLPRTSEELQQDIEPEPGERLAVRAEWANAYLTMLLISGALIFAADAVLLVRVPGSLGWVLPGVFAVAMLLRTKHLVAVWQRSALAVSGSLGLLSILVAFAVHTTFSGLAALVVIIALVTIGALRLPTTRLLPVWGHTGDIAELWTAIALVPLLLQLLHVFAFFRALAG